MPRTLLVILAALLLGLGVAACGGDDDPGDESEAAAISIPQDPAADIRRIVEGIDEDTESKPEIAAPLGSPPAELETRDIVKGEGARAKKGDTLTMQYVGVAWSTGEQFAASWDSGQPLQFELGSGMVIPGWDEGLVGMREGGRRLLVIPAAKGYGPQGQGPIGPNETLIFAMDLVEVG